MNSFFEVPFVMGFNEKSSQLGYKYRYLSSFHFLTSIFSLHSFRQFCYTFVFTLHIRYCYILFNLLPTIKMQLQTTVLAAIFTLASAQSFNIPNRVGSIVHLSAPMAISGAKDMGYKEYDRGHACNSDKDTGSANAVFILENGATLSNVIIGADSLEGVHCKGACTLKNLWFRDVCEGMFI